MKTAVIGEIGSNYKSLDDVKVSIEAIKATGSIPKLQAFTHAEVNTPNPEFPRNWMVELKDSGVFYSVFGLDSLKFLEDKVNPQYYKIASSKSKDKELIQAVAEIGKPTYISTGYCNLEDIRNIARWFRDASGETLWWSKLNLMQCNPTYPSDTDLIGNLRNRVSGSRLIQWGLSSHSIDIISVLMAIAVGASSIEKHVKLYDMDTPDNGHSLPIEEFKMMIQAIEMAERHMETRE